MDLCLAKLKKRLPFGGVSYQDHQIHGSRNPTASRRQHRVEAGSLHRPDARSSTKAMGQASDPVPDKTLLRACGGQLAWV